MNIYVAKLQQKKKKNRKLTHYKLGSNTLQTLTFFSFGVPRVFSVLFFRFLDLLLLTRLTVSFMLVGVCWVAVYEMVEGETSSSPLSVALLSPAMRARRGKSQDFQSEGGEKQRFIYIAFFKPQFGVNKPLYLRHFQVFCVGPLFLSFCPAPCNSNTSAVQVKTSGFCKMLRCTFEEFQFGNCC